MLKVLVLSIGVPCQLALAYWLLHSQWIDRKAEEFFSSEARKDAFVLLALSVFVLWSAWNWLLFHLVVGILWSILLIPYSVYKWVEYKFK